MVPETPLRIRSATSQEGRRIVGELQAEVPCRLELTLGQEVCDVMLSIQPKDVLAAEEDRQVTLSYPYPFAQRTDGQVVLPFKEEAGAYPRVPLSGDWLYPQEHLVEPWFALTAEAAGLLCVLLEPADWHTALKVVKTGKGRDRTPQLAPVWRNTDGVIESELAAVYHVTSGTTYPKLSEAFEALAGEGKEREL